MIQLRVVHIVFPFLFSLLFQCFSTKHEWPHGALLERIHPSFTLKTANIL